MDDAHACSDNIRDASKMKIPRDDAAYDLLFRLFSDDLEQQGEGSFADIANKQYDAILPVPYWAWMEKTAEVAAILSKAQDRQCVKFAWPLLKDMLQFCQCVVSGTAIEIEPYISPLEKFGTYWNAVHRIFMSATVTDDAFLIKGLQLNADTITNPLTYEKERWSGEKMVLIPSLIADELTRSEIVNAFARPAEKNFGIVGLVTSAKNTKDWETYGAFIADKKSVGAAVGNLRNKKFEKTVVLVNRYDGIDLADNTCRILVFDGMPYSESLVDLYQEQCRADSQTTYIRVVRTVEQGLGRSVRGEKDYSVIIVLGAELVRLLRDKNSQKYLSPQTKAQIEIGLEIAEMAEQEIAEGEEPMKALMKLVRQCLSREDAWKAYYVEQMEQIKPTPRKRDILDIYATELKAEQKYNAGDYAGATKEVQSALDSQALNENDKAWYLQEMARYNYQSNRTEFQRLQVAAFKANHYLLKPPTGITVTKLTIVTQGRMERIIDWVKKHGDYHQLNIVITDILTRLAAGTKAEKFEQALDDLSLALGFKGERPDKAWKEGPDNLWALDATHYILWECKSEVDSTRAEIHKTESEQMNRSCAWFERHYPGCEATYILIHPAKKVSGAAAFSYEVGVFTNSELRKFREAIRGFFKSFESLDFNDLSPQHIQTLVDSHGLGAGKLPTYAVRAVTI